MIDKAANDIRLSDLENATSLRTSGRFAESLEIFRRYALEGDWYAQVQLGDMLDRGLGGARHAIEARRWLEAAKNSGDKYCRLRFARFLEAEGERARAFNEVKSLADANYPPAQYRLAKYYEAGFGTDKNLEEHERYLMRAVNSGHYLALRTLAVSEMSGKNGLLRIPIGVAKFLMALLYVSRLAVKDPDNANLKN
jgi:TPR repeat protein